MELASYCKQDISSVSDAESPQNEFSTLGVEFKIIPWIGSNTLLKMDHTYYSYERKNLKEIKKSKS